ncbi:MAG: TRAM domain-containing protein [Clostridia bacterium]
MMKKLPKVANIVAKLVFIPLMFSLGYIIFDRIGSSQKWDEYWGKIWYIFACSGTGVVLGAVGFFIGPLVFKLIYNAMTSLSLSLKRYSPYDILGGLIGLIAGFVLSFLIMQVFALIKNEPLFITLSVLAYTLFGIGGFILGVNLISPVIAPKSSGLYRVPKVLDSSVLIDGRVLEIVKAGFISSPLVIPDFILKELSAISDSADMTKRNRGRCGLDIVKQLQSIKNIEVIIDETSFEGETDEKLISLTKSINGKLVTIDYNLNKLADVKKIPVLNINELTNAVKTTAIPGEKITITILKEGKPGQGVAYLNDGTMVVVEDGGSSVGATLDVTITSSLQTNAGRMIFAKIKP